MTDIAAKPKRVRHNLSRKEMIELSRWLDPRVETFEDGTCVYRDPDLTDAKAAAEFCEATGIVCTPNNVVGLRSELFGPLRKPEPEPKVVLDDVAVAKAIADLTEAISGLADGIAALRRETHETRGLLRVEADERVKLANDHACMAQNVARELDTLRARVDAIATIKLGAGAH
jgi:hypothetical protein